MPVMCSIFNNLRQHDLMDKAFYSELTEIENKNAVKIITRMELVDCFAGMVIRRDRCV